MSSNVSMPSYILSQLDKNDSAPGPSVSPSYTSSVILLARGNEMPDTSWVHMGMAVIVSLCGCDMESGSDCIAVFLIACICEPNMALMLASVS